MKVGFSSRGVNSGILFPQCLDVHLSKPKPLPKSKLNTRNLNFVMPEGTSIQDQMLYPPRHFIGI